MAYPRFRAGSEAGPDPYGQAAILLVETLVHGLITRGVITTADALEIVQDAWDVKSATGVELGDTPESLSISLALLEAIRDSLNIDLPGDE